MLARPLANPQRERDPEGRRSRILVAAGKVFAKAGFAAGSVREICVKAGVNVAAVNYYFGSKGALYREVLLAAHRQLLEQEQPPVSAAEVGAEESLRQWIGFCLRFVLLKRASHPVLGKLMAHEMMQPTAALGELVRLVIQPRFQALRETIANVAGGSLPADEVEMLAHSVVGMCLHYEHSREVIQRLGFSVPRTEAGIARLAESIADLAVQGIQRSPKQGRVISK